MTVVLACTDGLAELVAVTDTGKLPRGVPCCFPVAPWHPANASTPSKPTKNIPSRSLAFVLFRPPTNIPTNPSSGSGNSRAAYTGAVLPMPPGKAEARFAVVVIVSVTWTGPIWFSVIGLKVQAAPNGKFEQLKRMLPNVGLKDVTVSK